MEAEHIIDTLFHIEDKQALKFPVQELGLSTRVRHRLLKTGFCTVAELVHGWGLLVEVRSLGNKSLLEIEEKLNSWYLQYQNSGCLNPHDQQVNRSTEPPVSEDVQPEAQPMDYMGSLSHIPVEELELSTRVYNWLKRKKINTVDQIYRQWDFLGFYKNFGSATRAEISTALASLQVPHDDQETNNKRSWSRDSIASLKKVNETQALNSIDHLGLSHPLQSLLQQNGINTIDQLTSTTLRELKSQGIIDLPTVMEIERARSLWWKRYKKQSPRTLASSRTTGDRAIRRPHLDERIPDLPVELLDLPIEALDVPNRVYTALKRNELHTINDFYRELSVRGCIRGVGPFTLQLTENAIAAWQRMSDLEEDHRPAGTPSDLNLAGDGAEFSGLRTKPIYHLKLRGDVLSLLKKNNILTIHQLTAIKLEELRDQRVINFSQKAEIQIALHRWLGEDRRRQEKYRESMQDNGFNALAAEVNFEDYFNAFIDSLNTRWVSVLERRYGLKTGQKETLAETAAHFGVTRERIRQIEDLSLRKLEDRQDTLFQSQLFEEMQAHIVKRGGFISEPRLVEELNNVLALRVYSMKGILRFIRKLFDEEIQLPQSQTRLMYLRTLQGWTTSHWDKGQILQASQKVPDILSDKGCPIQWPDLYTALVHKDGSMALDEQLARAVALGLSDTKRIYRRVDGGWSKLKKPPRWPRIISVMNEIGQASHFSEIAEKYNRLHGDQPLSEKVVLGLLCEREAFVRVGRGKYGLRAWGLHDDGSVANAVHRVLVSHAHPMDLSEIVDDVLKTWDVLKSSILTAINADARFSKMEDGKVWLTASGLTVEKRGNRDDKSRGERLFSILKGFGQPLAMEAIADAYNKAYPGRPLTALSAKQLMYRRKDIFTYLGSNTFALAEWGMEVFRDRSRDRKKEIIDLINEQGPIHIRDLFELYNQKYADSPIRRNTLNRYLSDLRHVLSRPQRAVYDLKTLHSETG